MTTDHLGSPRVITNENGVVTSRKDYTAFGEENFTAQRTTDLGYSGADDIRKGYTGYEKDDESGLDFAQARYYNSGHGRYTSVDPLTASASIKNPQTFSRYSYVLNSPYKFTDPLGLLPLTSAGACGNFCSNSFSGKMSDGAFTGRDPYGSDPTDEGVAGGNESNQAKQQTSDPITPPATLIEYAGQSTSDVSINGSDEVIGTVPITPAEQAARKKLATDAYNAAFTVWSTKIKSETNLRSSDEPALF